MLDSIQDQLASQMADESATTAKKPARKKSTPAKASTKVKRAAPAAETVQPECPEPKQQKKAPALRLVPSTACEQPRRDPLIAFQANVRFTITDDFRRVGTGSDAVVTMPLSARLVLRITDTGGSLDRLAKRAEHVLNGRLTLRKNPRNLCDILSASFEVNGDDAKLEAHRTAVDPDERKSPLPAGVVTRYCLGSSHALEFRRIEEPKTEQAAA